MINDEIRREKQRAYSKEHYLKNRDKIMLIRSIEAKQRAARVKMQTSEEQFKNMGRFVKELLKD